MMTGWFPRKLQAQLMLLTSGAMLAVIVIYAGHTLNEQTGIARGSIEQQAAALARNLAISSAGPLVLGNIDVIDELLERSADFHDVIELQICDPGGRVLSHVARASTQAASSRVFDSPAQRLTLPQNAHPVVGSERVRGSERLVAWYPITAGNQLGWIRADFSTATIDTIRRGIWLSTLAAVALVTVGGSLLLYLFLRRPMRALEAARQFAIILDRSEGTQLPPTPAPVEIEDLERALNTASTNLHQQRLQLADIIGRLRQQEIVLSKRNAQLDAIFTLSPDGFVSFDNRHCVDYANPAFLHMTGLTLNDIAGLEAQAFSIRLAALCEPDARFPGMHVMRTAGIDAAGQRQLLTLADASKRILEVKLRTAEEGSVSQILYFRDITHEAEVDRMKSEFLSHAAHELRTPMTSIYGFSEVLLNMSVDEATQQELLSTIHRQTGSLVDIINELLDLARIDARRGRDLHMETVDLAELVRATLADLAFDPAHWPIHFTPSATPMQARADPAKLRQALINVVGNAQKYSPQGGAICIELSREPGAVGIAITDHGIGIQAKDLPHVGERFWRADVSGKMPGSGLGMAIVKEILQLHGGRLAIASEFGKGTRMTLWLPCGTSGDRLASPILA